MGDSDQQAKRGGWALIRRAAGEQRRGVIAGATFGLIWTAAKVAVPSATKVAIDRGVVQDQPGALLRWTLVIAGLGLIQATAMGFRRYQAFGLSWKAEAGLRARLFAHLQRLHFAFHDQAQTGQLMSRAATDMQQVQGFFTMVPITISNIVIMVAVTTILVLTNPGLALLALGSLPLVNIAAKRFSSRIHPVSVELQGELAGVATVVEETVTGIRVVKGFGAEPILAARLRAAGDRVLAKALEATRIRANFNPVLDFLPNIGLVAVLWYGGHQVLEGHLTPGELVAFNFYVLMLIPPLRMTGQIIAQAQRAVAAAGRIDEILATEPRIVDPVDPRPLPRGRGDIEFDHVSFGYTAGTAHRVLTDFQLHIRAGEAVALVGSTGCGKTTAARLIPRFYDVDDGAVRIDGVDVRDLCVSGVRSLVGIVFEDTFLFGDSVRANIAFADPDAPQAEVERAARLSGAHDFITAMPEGYETVIGERGFSLSGGQRQRIALARAILADPRILILDDATSSVDPTKEHEIRDALAEAMRGRTTIVIAHRPATIALADRVVLLDHGRVIAEGTHDSLLATNARYREVLAHADEDTTVDAEVTGVPRPRTTNGKGGNGKAANGRAAKGPARNGPATNGTAPKRRTANGTTANGTGVAARRAGVKTTAENEVVEPAARKKAAGKTAAVKKAAVKKAAGKKAPAQRTPVRKVAPEQAPVPRSGRA